MGHHNIKFSGDPHALHGAWSPPTSRANFCEEDYSITHYLAEFINTLTNLTYVYYALHAISSRKKTDFMSLSLLILGICSSLFHATLLLPLEFSDELSMLSLAWSLLQGSLTINHDSNFINVFLSIFFLSFAGFYVWSAKIIYHSIVFMSILGVLVLRTIWLIYGRNPGFPTQKRNDWTKRALQVNGILVLAFVLWHIDLEFCAELRALRDSVGLPWAWVFELHGWWHIFTGMGAAWYMDIVREMKDEARKQKEE
ncbi:ceramidase [Podospora fimiseda]|uniref:Ceramidase n=1 Tax=Podospora fimiseda TaxID=252190 RepID=A0AAN6YN09_9PEZI|nr:ceramidase [Podospora fimiseda]